ncbi:hypothetical protein AwWohl_05880 [Gammaproteobacteria bacterium]|nr:hypothetical protein AwWohl_05880 [Gammaproteobacteria bacterium]
MLYDSMALSASLMLVVAAWLPFNKGEAIGSDTLILLTLMRISLVLTFFSFFSFFWHRDGQTLGMRAWKIRMQQKNGENITYIQSILRICTALISFSCFGLGYFWIIIDPSKQAWHDKWTGTEVVSLSDVTR